MNGGPQKKYNVDISHFPVQSLNELKIIQDADQTHWVKNKREKTYSYLPKKLQQQDSSPVIDVRTKNMSSPQSMRKSMRESGRDEK